MSEAWETVSLSDVCDITSNLVDPREPEYIDLPHIGAGNMKTQSNELVDVQTAREEGLKSGKYGFDTSMVLYSKIRPYLMKVCRPNFGGLCSADVYPLSPQKELLDREYLFHLLLTKHFTDYAIAGSARAGMPKVNRSHLFAYQFPLPPLSEQKRIVSILDEAFGAIERAKENAQKNLNNARELFESYLNRVFTEKGEGWEEKKIPEVCIDFGRGKSRHRPRNEPSLYGGPYPFIQTGDLSNADHLVREYKQTYSEKGLEQSKLWPKGTVGIAIVGATIGETGVLDFDACFPDSVIAMNANRNQADPYFIEFMLCHFIDLVKSHGEGSARENINLATFDRLKFPMPPVAMQKQLVSEFRSIASKGRELERLASQKLTALDELTQSILQKAFTGQLTAKSPELEAVG